MPHPNLPDALRGAPAADAWLDTGWYRPALVALADLYNGGLDGASGLGAYRPGFDGLFQVCLDRRFQPLRRQRSTAISHSRAIYINAQACRAAEPADQPRFVRVIEQGAAGLQRAFGDAHYGGCFWEVRLPGGQPVIDEKRAYGNAHALFALAHAYQATRNPAHLQAAVAVLDILKTHFLDARYPGAIRSAFDRTFTRVLGDNCVGDCVHWLEALLALHSAAGTADAALRERAAGHIRAAAGFAHRQLVFASGTGARAGGAARMLAVSHNYDANWQPRPPAGWRHAGQRADVGHGTELALLLHQCADLGFDPAWRETADGLLAFSLAHAIDPASGGVINILDSDTGQPAPADPDSQRLIRWPQSEMARLLLYLTVVRGHRRHTPAFKRLERLLHGPFTDRRFGGWYDHVALGAPPVRGQISGVDKGHIWKVNYHCAALYADIVRLGGAMQRGGC